jgi:hypothetical protein
MSKQAQAFTFLQTTGAGIAIGTNIDLAGFIRGSDLAGTVNITASGLVLVASAPQSMFFAVPIALNGAVTMTSSAGKDFIFIYRNR